ncbi:MAG: murein hydrolase activator EnvC family protein [Nitrospiraceae bacterium]
MKVWIAALTTASLVCAMWALPLALAGKDSKDPLSKKIERQRRTLEKLQGEIRQNKKSINQTEKKKQTELEAIQHLDKRLARYRQDREYINRKLRRKDRQIEGINAQIGELQARIKQRRSSILARLRVQYIEGRFGNLGVLLGTDDYASFHRRFQYLSAVSKREYDLMESFRHDIERLEQVEHDREDARGEMLGLKRTTEKTLARIRNLKRQKTRYVAKLSRQKESYERVIKEKQQSASRVDALLKELEQRRKAAAARALKRGSAGALKGLFRWPAEGEVVSFFGRQKHPNFDTYVHRKGIEIRTEEGSPIKAVMAGEVAYADWLKGYGLVIILDHGNGFFSLYAHASKLLVRAGKPVRVSQVIGETGDTGMTKDNKLYFELRKGANPVDPLVWLASKK